MNAILAWAQRRESVLAGWIVLAVAGFGLTTDGFLDPLNLADRSRHWVETGLIALPMTFIIAAGAIDLSVGSLLALAGMAAGLTWSAGGGSFLAGLLAAIGAGLLGGALNGALIAWARVPALVATLATMAAYRGLALGLSGAQPVTDLPEGLIEWSGSGALAFGGAEAPWTVLLLAASAAAATALYHRHAFGRQMRQIGENPLAARFAGVPVERRLFAAFVLSGLMCGLASLTWTGRFATAHPDAGLGLELEVIAVVILGGSRITGGRGTMAGTFLGLLLLGLVQFGLDLNGVRQQHQIMLIGGLLLAVAILNERWKPT